MPVLETQDLDSDSRNITYQRRDDCASQTAIVPRKDERSDQPIEEKETNRDVDVYLRVPDR